MTVESPPPHVQTIVDAYRWRSEKPQVHTFEHNKRASYLVIGASTMTLTEEQPSSVAEVIVLAHVVDLSTAIGTLQLTLTTGNTRVLTKVNEAEVLGAILDRLAPAAR